MYIKLSLGDLNLQLLPSTPYKHLYLWNDHRTKGVWWCQVTLICLFICCTHSNFPYIYYRRADLYNTLLHVRGRTVEGIFIYLCLERIWTPKKKKRACLFNWPSFSWHLGKNEVTVSSSWHVHAMCFFFWAHFTLLTFKHVRSNTFTFYLIH